MRREFASAAIAFSPDIHSNLEWPGRCQATFLRPRGIRLGTQGLKKLQECAGKASFADSDVLAMNSECLSYTLRPHPDWRLFRRL